MNHTESAMRKGIALVVLLALCAPAGAFAADPMQEAVNQQIAQDRDQREKLRKTANEIENDPAKAAAVLQKTEKPFPGPVSPAQQQPTKPAAPSTPVGGAPQKSGKAIYGDIIIHK